MAAAAAGAGGAAGSGRDDEVYDPCFVLPLLEWGLRTSGVTAKAVSEECRALRRSGARLCLCAFARVCLCVCVFFFTFGECVGFVFVGCCVSICRVFVFALWRVWVCLCGVVVVLFF